MTMDLPSSHVSNSLLWNLVATPAECQFVLTQATPWFWPLSSLWTARKASFSKILGSHSRSGIFSSRKSLETEHRKVHYNYVREHRRYGPSFFFFSVHHLCGNQLKKINKSIRSCLDPGMWRAEEDLSGPSHVDLKRSIEMFQFEQSIEVLRGS